MIDNNNSEIKIAEIEKENTLKISVVKTAVIMAILTLVSKCFGFIREMVLAGAFGATYVVDAYVMAQSIPNILLSGIFAAIATAYMPLFSVEMEKKGEKAGNIFTSKIITITLAIAIIGMCIGVIFSKELVSIFASGFNNETLSLTSTFLKIAFFSVAFSSISGILEAYLQYKNVFIRQIVIGYLQNIIVIASICICYFVGSQYLAFGLMIGNLIRCVFMYVQARRKGYRHEKSDGMYLDTVKQILALSMPIFIGTYITQINTFVDKSLASSLVEGSVSALNYANILNTTIISLTVTIIVTILYPKMARAETLKDSKTFNDMLDKSISVVLIIIIPFTLGAMVYDREFVSIVYERGAFDTFAAQMTTEAFMFYAIGMTFSSVNMVLTKVFFAKQNTIVPVICSTLGVITNVILNLILVKTMQHMGLALATSIACAITTIAYIVGIKIKYKDISINHIKLKLLKIITGSIISVGVSAAIYKALIGYFPLIINLGFAVIVAAIVYMGTLYVMKIEELKLIKNILKK